MNIEAIELAEASYRAEVWKLRLQQALEKAQRAGVTENDVLRARQRPEFKILRLELRAYWQRAPFGRDSATLVTRTTKKAHLTKKAGALRG